MKNDKALKVNIPRKRPFKIKKSILSVLSLYLLQSAHSQILLCRSQRKSYQGRPTLSDEAVTLTKCRKQEKGWTLPQDTESVRTEKG